MSSTLNSNRSSVLNRLVLSAQLLERGAMRYTPAGLPVLDLVLKHESELMHNGQARRIALEIKARGIGDITQPLGRLQIGSSLGFAGFLGPQRNGRGVVFHVTELDHSSTSAGPTSTSD